MLLIEPKCFYNMYSNKRILLIALTTGCAVLSLLPAGSLRALFPESWITSKYMGVTVFASLGLAYVFFGARLRYESRIPMRTRIILPPSLLRGYGSLLVTVGVAATLVAPAIAIEMATNTHFMPPWIDNTTYAWLESILLTLFAINLLTLVYVGIVVASENTKTMYWKTGR